MNLIISLVLSSLFLFAFSDRSYSSQIDSSLAQKNTTFIKPALKKVNLGLGIQYFRSSENELSIANIVTNNNIDWQVYPDETPNFGVDPTTTWFKKTFQFEHPQSDQYLLEIAYPALDYIDMYIFQNGEMKQSYHSGDRLVFKSRGINHRNFLFPIPLLDAHQPVDVYIKVQTAGALQLPIYLWDQQAFWEQDQYQLIAHTFFLAILITLALYNLMLFISLRDKTYILYVMYIACLAISQMSLRGMGFQLLAPNSPFISERMLLVSIGTAVFFACLFTRQFMALPRNNPTLNKMLLISAFLALIQGLGGLFMPYSLNLKLGILITAITCPLLLLAGLIQWFKGYKIARFFVLAWIVYLIGQFAITMSKFGLIPRTTWIEHGPEIGAGLEVILLSFALADRMNDERRKRYKAQDNALIHEKAAREAQEHALVIQHKANEELEIRVGNRTKELRETLDELSEANKKLHSLSNIDGLTQVGNRRSFDTFLDHEWRRCIRDRVGISLLLLDADHFKQVNDQYGHQTGDECLKFIAATLSGTVKRPADGVSRYGGEEFAIILPNTPEDGAKLIAERIRTSIEKKILNFEGKRVALTVSIGIAYIKPNAGNQLSSLVEKADQALYRAKKEGRNRVCVSQ